MTMMWVLLAVVVAIVLYGISVYNRLVKNKTMVEEGWSGVDVQLKRRSNLIPESSLHRQRLYEA